MRNLRDYTREELMALGAGEELDGLIYQMGDEFYQTDDGLGPSSAPEFVGPMILRIAELSPVFTLSPLSGGFVVKLEKDAGRGALPHACAVALVLAAREKEYVKS